VAPVLSFFSPRSARSRAESCRRIYVSFIFRPITLKDPVCRRERCPEIHPSIRWFASAAQPFLRLHSFYCSVAELPAACCSLFARRDVRFHYRGSGGRFPSCPSRQRRGPKSERGPGRWARFFGFHRNARSGSKFTGFTLAWYGLRGLSGKAQSSSGTTEFAPTALACRSLSRSQCLGGDLSFLLFLTSIVLLEPIQESREQLTQMGLQEGNLHLYRHEIE
jgi:hypothetical protein